MNDIADLVIELSGGGADTVITSASMTIPNQVEALQIAAGVTGISITGSARNDVLITNGLANNVNGGGGDDVILTGTTTLADIHALFGPQRASGRKKAASSACLCRPGKSRGYSRLAAHAWAT